MGKRAKREQRNAERRAAIAAVEGARTAAEAARHLARRAGFLAELAAQRCPACGSAEVAGIGYGLPRYTAELRADLDAGRVVLGGCDISGDDPVWVCRACQHSWGRRFPANFPASWRSETVVALATAIRADGAFDRMPILADALEEAGCEDAGMLADCRSPHLTPALGGRVVDLVLGKE
jgi:hypothetical protein